MPTKDVHTEHCCIRHGCKYGILLPSGVSICTVESGAKKQSYWCEMCEEEFDEMWVFAHLMNEMFEAGRTKGYNEAVAEARAYDDRYLR